MIKHGKTTEKKLKVIGYSRVSTEDQAKEGVSLEAQEEKIQAYCKAKGWELIDIIQDLGRSGKDLKRPGLQKIIEACTKKEKPFETVIVTKLDRITRSVGDLAYLNKFFQDNRIGFTSIEENVDTTSATGELFHNIVISISQWERKVIGERTREALQHKKNNSQRVGTIPYGFRLSNDGISLEKAKEEQAILTRIKSFRKRGLSYQKIATWLNKRGILPKIGKKWYASSVYSILKTINYTQNYTQPPRSV